MNATDLKYLSSNTVSLEEESNQRGRPANERYPFQKQHPQAKTHVLLKYSEYRVPILYGPQISRRDRDDTRERCSRALLTLFVPWRAVTDLCDVNQTWEDAFKSRQKHISIHSWNIKENIQLLHECQKDCDEHLLQVITEAQTDNDAIDPVLLPNEYTTVAINTTKKSTKDKYIEETTEAVENVGRFSHINIHRQFSLNEFIDSANQQLVPFVSATPNLVRLNRKWQEQLKTERQRARRTLITGNYDKTDDTLDLHAAKDAVITVMNPNNYNNNNFENYGSILPVVSVATNFPTQKIIADEFTLNREQRAAFMIITSHLDGDSRCRTGDNNGELIMCIPGCGGTGKSQLIHALSKYFLITKRIQMMRKLAPTGIPAAEIDGMTIHSFLGEQRNSGKLRTVKSDDSKLEKEWRLVEYLLIDEMSMVGLNLLAKLNRVLCSAKHVDPQIPFGGAPILVFRNEVRPQLNNKAAVHKAVETGQAPMVCVSQDTCKGKPIEDPRLINKLLELSDSKTEHLPGLLSLVPGMPVILTQNIAIELGLINGMNGIFRQLVYDEDSVSTDVISEPFPNNTRYIHKPLYAIIEIVRSKIECKFEQLQSNLVPIPLMEQTFRINIADVLPKDKKPKSNQKTILSIKRRALPLLPAYCITTHKSQGQTLNNVVIDLKLPNETDDIAAIYVPLSRVKRLADLIILIYFDYKILLLKPSKSQLAEIERLDKLYLETQMRFSEWL
ncbi:unnamed protein product [Rotaria sp. Silwood1]|nr:unnamed protein product [Rotaria sp. Silwood1]CAF4672870.1 unnamed protein product [Rotaria sp. Silwood1]